jgi:4-hydroxy-3-polyprenylbenzoate decarboxylase
LLERFEPRRDLHFQTQTTIDTLDYSGTALNRGSKLVIAATGPARRALPTQLPANFTLPEGFGAPRLCLPGVLAVQGPRFASDAEGRDHALVLLAMTLGPQHPINAFPLVVVCDDSEFAARSLDNWLWVTFTRSNPAADVQGVGSFTHDKHWGCTGALLIDARVKPRHAPPLVEDPAVSARVDALAARGGPLQGLW